MLIDNEYFVSLVELALDEDDNIGKLIRNLIYKDKNERIIYLSAIINDLEKSDCEIEIIESLKYLFNDEVIIALKKTIEEQE